MDLQRGPGHNGLFDMAVGFEWGKAGTKRPRGGAPVAPDGPRCGQICVPPTPVIRTTRPAPDHVHIRFALKRDSDSDL